MQRTADFHHMIVEVVWQKLIRARGEAGKALMLTTRIADLLHRSVYNIVLWALSTYLASYPTLDRYGIITPVMQAR